MIPTVQFLISRLNICSSTRKSLKDVRIVVYAVFLKSIMAKVKDNSAIAFGEYDGTRATVIPKSAAACRSI